MPTVSQLFSSAGALAREFTRFEARAGQLKMAEAVERAFATRRSLIVEAGTGTGKSLAFLLPALHLGEPVLISTGTKALQAQLLEREVPLALRATGTSAPIAVLKGRENYLCNKKLAELTADPRLELAAEIPLYNQLVPWAASSSTGDRAELPGLPDQSPLWRSVDGRAETCLGTQCPQYAGCFVYEARARAQAAQVVVVNHYLLFADLALRRSGAPGLLTGPRTLVIDEAHMALDAAARHFGRRVSWRMAQELARDAAQELARAARDPLEVATFERAARDLFAWLRPPLDGRASLKAVTQGRDLSAAIERIESALAGVRGQCQGAGPRAEERALLAQRCLAFSDALQELTGPASADLVVTVEPQGKEGSTLASYPIELGPLLEEAWRDTFDAVVATSATLAVAGKLERAAQRLGLPEATKLIVSSPFHHRKQAALYIPRQFPDPRDPQFLERALREIEALLEISRGRALVLFSSHRALQFVAGRLANSLPWPVLVQGDAPREQLLEQFRDEVHSVLLGTASFRQGIDVPGEALSMVIVDKLPFAVPDDPVVAARGEAVRRRGGNPFEEDQLPEAILDLRQAFGRLIRTQDDRGLLALLDIRVRTRNYGRTVLDSLPPWPLLDDLEQARGWLNR